MSSAARSTQSHLHQPQEPTAKKKFGKNLNKLTKPPAPPVTVGQKTSASSKNGLLLLSIKRNSTGNNASGILSSKSSASTSKQLPSLGLQYESNTSTHDALLGAVVGASRAEAQQPDAWGIAQQKEYFPVESKEEDGNRESDQGFDYTERETRSWDEGDRRQGQFETGEYDVSPRINASHGPYMSQIAKERAQARRAEEEAKFASQKERANQRLRELEEKLSTAPDSRDISTVATESTHRLVMEKLNYPNTLSSGSSTNHVAVDGVTSQNHVTTEARCTRTLYDPNRSYSSLLSSGVSANESSRSPVSVPMNGRSPLVQPLEPPIQAELQVNRQVIHLTSYEDRDRGERGVNAGPRMLYDPKSGSMVAVPIRDEFSAGGRGRKEKGKKPRNGRDSKIDTRQDIGSTAVEGAKGLKKAKARKEENVVQAKAKSGEMPSPAKGDVKKAKIVQTIRRLPRTCGVLYARDESGNCYCADGCDGDVGYGSHSVPGGRSRNPEAYSKYLETRKQMHTDEPPLYDDQYGKEAFDSESHLQDVQAIALQTGFSMPPEEKEQKIDWVKPNEKIVLMTGVDDSPTLQATAKEWAPSQAALAAAAAAIEKEKITISAQSLTSLDGHEEDNDTDDDDDGPVSVLSIDQKIWYHCYLFSDFT